jgi:phytanoyl-CoA hydroxylase
MLTPEQLADYNERGFLVLEGFAGHDACDQLRNRAEEMVQEFDPAEVVSIFSTREQNRLTDDYFMHSGDKIRFFFEENAFLPEGQLRFEKEKSIITI